MRILEDLGYAHDDPQLGAGRGDARRPDRHGEADGARSTCTGTCTTRTQDRRPLAFDPEAMIDAGARHGASRVTDPDARRGRHAAHPGVPRRRGRTVIDSCGSRTSNGHVAVEQPDLDELVRRCRRLPLRAAGRADPRPRPDAARCRCPRRDLVDLDARGAAAAGPRRVRRRSSGAAARTDDRHPCFTRSVRSSTDSERRRRPDPRSPPAAPAPASAAAQRDRQSRHEKERYLRRRGRIGTR